ncbi:MAG: hypothetical protein GXY48_11525 [Methanomicrobiales archaeon]|nr:hypothetical protein [Methanomicrobiales archaeon]
MKRPVTDECYIKGYDYLVWQLYRRKKYPKKIARRRNDGFYCETGKGQVSPETFL